MTIYDSLREKIRSMHTQEIRFLLKYLLLQPVTFQMERVLLASSDYLPSIRPALGVIICSYKTKVVQNRSFSENRSSVEFTDLISEFTEDLYINTKKLLQSDQTDIALDHLLCFQEFIYQNLDDQNINNSPKLEKMFRQVGIELIERYDQTYALTRSQRQALYSWIIEHKDISRPSVELFISDLMTWVRSKRLIKEYKQVLISFIDTQKRSSLIFWRFKYPKILKEYEDNKKAKRRK